MGNPGDGWTIFTCPERTPPSGEKFYALVSWHVRAASAYTDSSTLHQTWTEASDPLWRLLSTNVKAIGAFYRPWAAGQGGQVGYRFATPIPGNDGGLIHPTPVCVEVLRKSGLYGRNVNGRF